MSQGRIRYFVIAGPNWDPFTNSGVAATQQFIRQHLYGIGTYTPYFDNKLPWMPSAWVYYDSYSIQTGDSVVTSHPEWILKDANGNKLYVPWGCANGTCPQYAGDISNPLFIAARIAQIKQYLAGLSGSAMSAGYQGLWLDDVNLYMRTSDGNGNTVAPVVNGVTWTQAQWQTYFAQYVELIRAALPQSVSVVHNSIWTVPESDAVDRQIQACDFANLERGFGDPGLTGGTGQFSLSALFAFIDRVHALGKSVLVEDYYTANREYSTACYLMMNNGTDMLGFGDQLPDATWPANLFSTDVGAAITAHYRWQGLWRRDFTRGIVLANEPGAASVTVALPAPMYDENGVLYSTVTLNALQGMTLTSQKPG